MTFIQNYEYFLGINKTGVGMEGLVFVQGRLTFNIISTEGNHGPTDWGKTCAL